MIIWAENRKLHHIQIIIQHEMNIKLYKKFHSCIHLLNQYRDTQGEIINAI